jgi:hypothetical protein
LSSFLFRAASHSGTVSSSALLQYCHEAISFAHEKLRRHRETQKRPPRAGNDPLVLVHGAAGNVGAYAIQMGRHAGLRIIATADARDFEAVRGLGAQEIIDGPEAQRHPSVGCFKAGPGGRDEAWRAGTVLSESLPLLFLRRELCWPDPFAARPTMT